MNDNPEGSTNYIERPARVRTREPERMLDRVPDKASPHESIIAEILLLRSALYELQVLGMRIREGSAGPLPPSGAPDDAVELGGGATLRDFLIHAPAVIRRTCNEIKSQVRDIEQDLFGDK